MTAAPAPAPAPPPTASWVLLPLAWCVWLLAFLVPSLLVAPHLETLRPWLTADTAPAAVVAAAAFFLTAIWPFWPALAGPVSGIRGRAAARWFLVSLAEAVMLLALAAPFVVVAWSVGGQPLDAARLTPAAAVAVIPGMVFRVLAAVVRPQRVRWLVTAATLLAVAPLLAAYAAQETLGTDWSWMLRISPVYAAVCGCG
jgi:hypothetical protein